MSKEEFILRKIIEKTISGELKWERRYNYISVGAYICNFCNDKFTTEVHFFDCTNSVSFEIKKNDMWNETLKPIFNFCFCNIDTSLRTDEEFKTFHELVIKLFSLVICKTEKGREHDFVKIYNYFKKGKDLFLLWI